jgi:hypothetical protein
MGESHGWIYAQGYWVALISVTKKNISLANMIPSVVLMTTQL